MPRSPTTQDVSWFLDLHRKNQLDLDPPYQRRSVWSPRDKRYFVDTILNDHPAPAVFLHRTLDDSGIPTYHVVDGKQRLQTIIEFTENKIYIPDNYSDIRLHKKRWRDLDDETKKRFWNYVIVAEMIPDANEAIIRDVFDRINRNARTLTRQEMRHAKYDGWLIHFAENESARSEWEDLGVVTLARVKRMNDVQFISELCAVVIKRKVLGFSQDDLDDLYAEFEDISELSTFIEDNFLTDIKRLKSTLQSLLRIKPELLKYFKVLAHFYSIWSYLLLEEIGHRAIEEFADLYQSFMHSVDSVNTNVETVNPPDCEISKEVLDYARNSTGASTDLSQRLGRHNALIIGLGPSNKS